ncbi:hypothetical protein EDB85DRAFT_1891381 [Lactarius pseudohatsudake]|nr:hypothetical protein EDB85DRAFT_1891381 [Lactarius pseudohatsudake]
MPLARKLTAPISTSASSDLSGRPFKIEVPILEVPDFDPCDIRAPCQGPFPPEIFALYLHNITLRLRLVLGRHTKNDAPYDKFAATGDARLYRAEFKYSSQAGQAMLVRLPPLDCGVSRLKFAQSAHFNSNSHVPFIVGGVQYGVFKTAGCLSESFLNVFNAGPQSPRVPANSLAAGIRTGSHWQLLCST